jgi:hypothetical protein
MAKKSRRSRRSRRKSRPATKPPSPASAPEPTPNPDAQASADLGEYKYVITDLRRVAVLAAAMFALLIALSFLIQ